MGELVLPSGHAPPGVLNPDGFLSIHDGHASVDVAQLTNRVNELPVSQRDKGRRLLAMAKHRDDFKPGHEPSLNNALLQMDLTMTLSDPDIGNRRPVSVMEVGVYVGNRTEVTLIGPPYYDAMAY